MLIILGFITAWHYREERMKRQGQTVEASITHRKEEDGKYLIQYRYTVEGNCYENQNTDVWFQVNEDSYSSEQNMVKVRYLPQDPAVSLPRYTLLVIRNGGRTQLCSWPFWAGLGLFAVVMMLSALLVRKVFHVEGLIGRLLADLIGCSVTYAIASLYCYHSYEKRERFSPVEEYSNLAAYNKV